MLDSTYEVLARKKGELRGQIDELSDIEKERFAREWIDQELSPIKAVVGAEDGSYNLKKYKSFCLYVVNSCAVLHNGKVKEEKHADIGITMPYRHLEQRVRLYMGITELKTSRKILDEVEVLLLDGSIISDIVGSKRFERSLNKEEEAEVKALLPEVEEAEGPGVASLLMEGRFTGERKTEKMAFLEYLEYLSALKNLIEKGSEKVVALSKTSTSNDYFPKETTSDIALFDMSTIKSGFSKPRHIGIRQKIRQGLPIYEDFFAGLDFTLFYARLEDKKPVYRFEVPRSLKEEGVVEVLSKIKNVSIAGYPYLLKKAHNRVVIKNKDIKGIERSLGIYAKKWRDF